MSNKSTGHFNTVPKNVYLTMHNQKYLDNFVTSCHSVNEVWI